MEFQYELKYGKYKRLTIKISRNGQITVLAPVHYTEKMVAKIIAEKKNWIIKHLLKIETASETSITLKNNEILYLGEIYQFEKMPSIGKSYFINEVSKKITSGIDLTVKENLLKFFKERADFILKAKIIAVAKKHGFAISKAQVHNTKKRWGSCTSKKVITLSGRLIMAPEFVIDAIILHELTHIKFMDHSKNFYNELDRLCPFYEEACSWLKEKMPLDYPPESIQKIPQENLLRDN